MRVVWSAASVSPEIALIVGLVVLVGVWVLAVRDAVRASQPAKAMLAGRYAEARALASKLEQSWMRILPGVRASMRYTIASALHLEGDLEGSLTTLATVDRKRLDPQLRYAAASLEAANLVLVGRDPARVVTLIEEVRETRHPAEDRLLLAHAKHDLGDADSAEAIVDEATDQRTRNERTKAPLGRVLLAFDERQRDAIFHVLRGLYFVKVGKAELAVKDFEIAAKSAVPSIYTDKARSLIPRKNAGEADPRSSLAPQVIDET